MFLMYYIKRSPETFSQKKNANTVQRNDLSVLQCQSEVGEAMHRLAGQRVYHLRLSRWGNACADCSLEQGFYVAITLGSEF